MSSVLVFGKNGQLAKSLSRVLPQARLVGSDELNLLEASDFDSKLSRLLDEASPKTLILTSAYTAVDQAEVEVSVCQALNIEAPSRIARLCEERKIQLVCFSSDYVFSGEGCRPWTETDACEPLGVYGRSKKSMEERVLSVAPGSVIFRVSWLYSATGKNFVKTILKAAMMREQLQVVNDQVGAPTSTDDLAQSLIRCLGLMNQGQDRLPGGIYHLTSEQNISWFDFASSIVSLASGMGFDVQCREIRPLASDQFPAKAKRPKNSRLDCSKLRSLSSFRFPSLEDSIRPVLEELKKVIL